MRSDSKLCAQAVQTSAVWFLGLMLLSFLAGPAWAEKRIALVIGNSAYAHAGKLANPGNDAKRMADVLKALNFEVLFYRDLDLERMKRALVDFSGKLSRHGTDTVALVYYAGHGILVKGENYLIPINAEIKNEGDVDVVALRSSSLMEIVDSAKTRLNVVILDACRNNPFAFSRAMTRGLGRMDAPSGTLIAFSTSPGKVAQDGPADGNSPYTEALTRALVSPGVKIEDVFKNARKTVIGATKGEQTPWESSSLVDDFYPAGEPGVTLASKVDSSLSGLAPEKQVPKGVPRTVKFDIKAGPGELYSVAALADGGFATVGSTTAKGAGGADLWVLRFDAEGNLLWEKTFGGPLDDIGARVAQLSDGNLIVAGRSKSKGHGVWRGWLLRLNGKGDLLWDKVFGTDGLNSFSGLAVMPDGGFALAGVAVSKASGRSGWLLRVDSQGKAMWSKNFGAQGSSYDANDLTALPDGGAATVGSIRLDNLTSKAWIAQVDSQGRVLSDISVGGKAGEQATGIAALPDGGLAVAGLRAMKESSIETEAWVLRLDAGGKQLWSKTFGAKGRASSISALPGGGFIVVGNKAVDGKDNFHGWVARLDATGAVQWEKTFGGDMLDNAAAVSPLPDGGLVVTGTASIPNLGVNQGEGWLFTLPPEQQLMTGVK